MANDTTNGAITEVSLDYLAVLQRLGNGRLLEELAVALSSVCDEVVATGKPGQVTLTLKIATREQHDPMIAIAETITRKPPTRAPRGTYLYAVEGWLYSRDPRQTELPFRAVDDAAPTVREA